MGRLAAYARDEEYTHNGLPLGPSQSRVWLAKKGSVVVKITQRRGAWERERKTLEQLQHQNIVTLEDAFFERGAGVLVTDYSGVDAFTLQRYHAWDLTLQKTLSLAIDYARGLEYIHGKGIIHGDIRNLNLTINEERGTIIDFGSSVLAAKLPLLAEPRNLLQRIFELLFGKIPQTFSDYAIRDVNDLAQNVDELLGRSINSSLPFSFTAKEDGEPIAELFRFYRKERASAAEFLAALKKVA